MWKGSRTKGGPWRALAVLAFCALAGAARADAVSDFYKGRDITLILGYGPGGGYDSYIRLIARHLGRFMPGNPNINVQYMPGASSLTAAAYVYNIAAQDGAFVAAVSSTLPFAPLLDETARKFDPAKAQWLPSPSSDVAVSMVWHTVPVNSLEDARRREVVMGTGAVNGMASFFGRVVNELTGTKFKLVTGYQAGSAESLLAMERGESEGFPSMPWNSLKSTKPDWLRDGKVRLLLQLGGKPNPEVGAVPFIGDLVTKADDRALLDIAMGPLELGVPYMLGPGVPKERADALQAAFMAALKDEKLRADAATLNLAVDVNPMSGADVAAIIARAYAAPPEVISRLKVLYAGRPN